ncbi:hypothetical protein GCM10011492_10090 [Flexivirga endophytica]|uniref:Uncharacterized protein n=1 Tax=Flexivirga endophytica TaxID=1849103 RepID=A0A916SYK6_9MICO|nr:hypothetical protein [Flexivirga endophytica]GGB22287.1 hypothetical protein GCM10011492_10090 [Flexivirga endophytica]GHB56237.1 hypothetical protein GCM10008112_26630 [Flexivirga endophytica]
MPTIDDRLRDTGQAWREHVDAGAPQAIRPSTRARPSRHTRRTVLVAAAAVVVAGVGIPVAGVLARRAADHNGSSGGFAASCAGPQLQLAGEREHPGAAVVRAGQTLTVTGRFYLDSCQDTNHAPEPHPLTVGISLRGHGRTVLLRTVRAHGSLGTFRASVRIPADWPAGKTTLTTRTSGAQAAVAEGLPRQPLKLTVVN